MTIFFNWVKIHCFAFIVVGQTRKVNWLTISLTTLKNVRFLKNTKGSWQRIINRLKISKHYSTPRLVSGAGCFCYTFWGLSLFLRLPSFSGLLNLQVKFEYQAWMEIDNFLRRKYNIFQEAGSEGLITHISSN